MILEFLKWIKLLQFPKYKYLLYTRNSATQIWTFNCSFLMLSENVLDNQILLFY